MLLISANPRFRLQWEAMPAKPGILTAMKLAEILRQVRTLAREQLAEPWDKVGLQVGDLGQKVRRGLLCIDLTEAVLAEAVRLRCELVVAYHPPIFEPVTKLTTATWKERVLRDAVRHGIAVYSPHTALDADHDGVNDWLARGLGGDDLLPIKFPAQPEDGMRYNPQKIVTFVPGDHVDRVRNALADAGAGKIGRYGRCSFTVMGEGTFQGDETTHPAIGKPGRFERVPEVRLEMICAPAHLGPALRALVAAHPYEEPAIDVLETFDGKAFADDPPLPGPGRLARLAPPVTLQTLVSRVKRLLGVKQLVVAKPTGAARRIRRIGVCAGAGGSLFNDAAAAGCDAFVTGEMRHHDMLDAAHRGVAVILAGHSQTERPYLPVYRQRLMALKLPGVTWHVSKADVAPGG